MQYTRLTFFGSRRTADIVLPDDEPVGALLPEVLDLLDEPPGTGSAPTLVTTLGRRINADQSLREQQVAQGAMIRVVEVDDAPQSPEVADVTDTVARLRGTRKDIWGPTATSVASSVVAGIGAFYAVTTGMDAASSSATPALLVVGVAVVLAAIAARREAERVAVVLASLAGGAGLAASLALTGSAESHLRFAAATGILWSIVAAVPGWGSRRGSALAGGLLGLANSGAIVLLHVLTPDGDPIVISTVITVVDIALLGLLPGIAAAASGLTRFDDLVIAGTPAVRSELETVVEDSFAALTWSIAAVLPPLGLAAAFLLTGEGFWGPILGGIAFLISVLRSRLFPLIVQKSLVAIMVLLGVGSWLVTTAEIDDPIRAVIAAGIAVLAVLATVVRPAAVVRARARRWLSMLELIAVLAVIPSALGVLGIFDDLFAVFR